MYSTTERIRFSETDEELLLTPEGVLNYFQDCSTFQSEDLEIGMEYLKNEELVWIVSSWQIIIERYPALGEQITVGTMPYEFRGCFGFRNYIMTDADGERIAYANAQYCLMSTADCRPSFPTEKMKEAYILGERLDMDYAPRKIKVPEGGEHRLEVEIKRQHLDANKHVNNGQYIRIALEALKNTDQITEKSVWQIRAQYKKEAELGDMICPHVVNGEDTTWISLENAEGVPFAIVELKGKP